MLGKALVLSGPPAQSLLHPGLGASILLTPVGTLSPDHGTTIWGDRCPGGRVGFCGNHFHLGRRALAGPTPFTLALFALRYPWPWPCSRASVPYPPTPALVCVGHPQGRGPARVLEVSWSQGFGPRQQSFLEQV